MSKLIYGTQEYRLEDGTDLAELRTRITRLLNGDVAEPFLEVPVKGERTAWLLVTPHTPIAIEESAPTGKPRAVLSI